MLPIRAYHRTDVYIFILESKNWTPTLRMTYIKTCFINILIQISPTYTVLTGGTEVAWLLQNAALHAWSTRHLWFWSTRANLFPALCGCYHLQRFALALCWWFLSSEQMCQSGWCHVCHLPCATSSHLHSCSPGVTAVVKPGWHTACCHCSGDIASAAVAEGTAAGRDSLQLSPLQHFSPMLRCYTRVSWTQWKQIPWLIHSWKNSSLSSI